MNSNYCHLPVAQQLAARHGATTRVDGQYLAVERDGREIGRTMVELIGGDAFVTYHTIERILAPSEK